MAAPAAAGLVDGLGEAGDADHGALGRRTGVGRGRQLGASAREPGVEHERRRGEEGDEGDQGDERGLQLAHRACARRRWGRRARARSPRRPAGAGREIMTTATSVGSSPATPPATRRCTESALSGGVEPRCSRSTLALPRGGARVAQGARRRAGSGERARGARRRSPRATAPDRPRCPRRAARARRPRSARGTPLPTASSTPGGETRGSSSSRMHRERARHVVARDLDAPLALGRGVGLLRGVDARAVERHDDAVGLARRRALRRRARLHPRERQQRAASPRRASSLLLGRLLGRRGRRGCGAGWGAGERLPPLDDGAVHLLHPALDVAARARAAAG